MPIALTVFGVEADELDLTLAYVMLRTVRGSGAYPDPNLPKDLMADGAYRTDVPDSALTLVTWDKVIPETEEKALQNEIDQGRLLIPEECPIAGGQTIIGLPFGPLIIEEEFLKAKVTGTGLLYRKGIASETLFVALNEAFNKSLKPGTAPKALRALGLKLGELSGIGKALKTRTPIGVVEFFFRPMGITGMDGLLFEVVPDKPDFRTKDPMLRVRVCRFAAPLDLKFKLQVTLQNYDEVIRSTLIEIEAGVSEVIVSAPAHITDVSVSVFDNAGDLADQLNAQFLQSVAFGISTLGRTDTLPPLFPGNTKSHDLVARPRVHTLAFEGPSIDDRSGGLDVLRKQAISISALIGSHSTEAENIWFERGVESQLEVIRWIKKKVEQPGVTTAYLVDPYLGSEAFKRVVARQGNETAELFIVVSPGDIDPDADRANTSGVSAYLEKLKSTMTEWAHQLAGRISVVHIKRGNGSEQAFHDRYLCTIDQKGVPTAYLLSNSLSKAAGDWPFAICALSQIMSRRVYAYILELVRGDPKNSNLQPEVIWKSEDVMANRPNMNLPPPPSKSEPSWEPVKVFLSDIFNIIIRNSEFKPQVDARLNAFLSVWPDGMDEDKLAGELFKIVSHRDAIVAFVSERLRDAGRAKVAQFLDDKLLDQFLEQLPGLHHKGRWFVPSDARRSVLESLGRTIARKQNATNFIRAKLNSKTHELVTMIETQRLDYSTEAHQTSLYLSIIALQVVTDSEDISERYRIGVANDYIHWLGRLMRSHVAASMYVTRDRVFPDWLDNLTFAAQQLAKARRALGDTLDKSIARVKNDPWVAPIFKDAITAALSDAGRVT
ncbi:MAG: VPA1262 family N-terminal domain-containing protein [Pseudomonas sp.]